MERIINLGYSYMEDKLRDDESSLLYNCLCIKEKGK